MSVMIEDKNGVELHLGDTIMDDSGRSGHPYLRFCYGYRSRVGRKSSIFAIVLDDDGDSHMIPAKNGVLSDHLRIEAASDYRFTPTGHWVDSANGPVCEYCGSPIPVRSGIDDIKKEDNRFCYFCGAVLGG